MESKLILSDDNVDLYKKYDIKNNISEPILTKYEYTKILGQRLSQLNNGYNSFVTREGHIDNTSIAEEEIKKKLLPIIIRRPLWSGASEYWMLEDLEIFR